VPTARNSDYPRELQASSEVLIQLPERYPLDMPFVTFKTPIWNPNVFSSGRWCFGEWKITENLELFVLRLIKAIALDPSIINLKSPANTEAADWYQRKLTAEPGVFPTIPVANLFAETPKKNLIWRELR
jgi:hypothetical protein